MVYRPLGLPPVLNEALDLFVEHGYHGTTVRDIARQLNQTVPMIYYWYENKQALLVALLSQSIDDLLDRCEKALSSVGDDPEDQLSVLVRCLLLYVANRRQLALLDQEVRSLESRNRPAYIVKRDKIEHMLVASIESGVTAGIFTVESPQVASRALISMCRGIASWYRSTGSMTPEAMAAVHVQFALALVGCRALPQARERTKPIIRDRAPRS
jgi:AcrR family transcriptional regulator